MNISYIKFSPTGNITVLVTTPVPRAQQPGVAAALLGPGGVGGEQVGFIEAPGDPRAASRLQMMGGEFCGNATMSLGTLLARGAGLADGEGRDFLLEVSGSAAPVPCRIRRAGEAWTGTVDMPVPTALRTVEIDTDAGALAVTVVELPGIAHLIIPAEAGVGEEQLRRRLPLWNGALGAEALGALTWDGARRAIDPLVYVPSAGTLVREHGCGSGTAAVGCWLALAAGKSVEIPVAQPGGTITARVEVEGHRIAGLTITGRVTAVGEGTYQF